MDSEKYYQKFKYISNFQLTLSPHGLYLHVILSVNILIHILYFLKIH